MVVVGKIRPQVESVFTKVELVNLMLPRLNSDELNILFLEPKLSLTKN